MDFVETVIDKDILYKSEKDNNVNYSSDQDHDNSVKKIENFHKDKQIDQIYRSDR